MGGVPQSELPDAPIAFSYRTPEEARRRAEDWADQQQRAGGGLDPRLVQPSRPDVADLVASEDNVNEILERLLGRAPGEPDRHLGRLALLDPRSGAIDVIEAARRGAIPLAWSEDRKRLLFAQPGSADFQIYEYERERKTVRPVTHGPDSHTQACYGPQGRVVVATVDTREQPVRSRIAVSGPGGRPPFRALTEGPADHSPACRPDGQIVVFVREEAGQAPRFDAAAPPRSDLISLDLRDGSRRRLSPGRHPSFGPDGEWVVYAAPYQRELRIWRIRADGTGRAPVGRGMRPEARPALSPDGALVAYVAGEDPPRRHLYLRRFDGSGDRILFADGDGEFPVW